MRYLSVYYNKHLYFLESLNCWAQQIFGYYQQWIQMDLLVPQRENVLEVVIWKDDKMRKELTWTEVFQEPGKKMYENATAKMMHNFNLINTIPRNQGTKFLKGVKKK